MNDRAPHDIVIQRRVEVAIAAGHIVPRWGWNTPADYNGCTGAERIAGWQKVRVAEQLGLIRRIGLCSVCHIETAAQFHAEIYLRPLVVRPVCRGCHFHIHRRFHNPDRWAALLQDRAKPSDWSLCLRTDQLSRADAEKIAAAPDIFISLAC